MAIKIERDGIAAATATAAAKFFVALQQSKVLLVRNAKRNRYCWVTFKFKDDFLPRKALDFRRLKHAVECLEMLGEGGALTQIIRQLFEILYTRISKNTLISAKLAFIRSRLLAKRSAKRPVGLSPE